MSTYERITFRSPSASPSRTVILRDPTEAAVAGESVIRGVEVNRHGDVIAPGGADERVRVIGKALVTRRVPLVMDPHYGELGPAQ